MVLTKQELIATLQNEVRILLHLITKVDRTQLTYRPTKGQRSTGELLRYLSMMGPALVRYALAKEQDAEIWTAAERESESRNFEESVAAIAGQAELYRTLLAPVPESAFREEITNFDGTKVSRGLFLMLLVLGGCVAYRTQLFLYLKASGRSQLSSSDLWDGADTPPG